MRNVKWFSTTEQESWKEIEYNEIEKTGDVDLRLTGETDQVIDGFGACFNELCEIALEDLSTQDRDKVLDLLFKPDEDGLRLTYNRMPIGASDFAERWYSYNEVEDDYEMEHFSIDGDRRYLLPMIKDAYKRNGSMILFASPWSPPTWMKFPKAHNFGTLKWNEKNLKAYALYFAKFVEAYENEGIKIEAVHVQNEPFSDQKFPSCKWTGEQFIEFIGKYLGPTFKERGLNTKIFLGTLNSGIIEAYNEYINAILHDSDASKYLDGIGIQWAGKGLAPLMHESWPEVYTIQTENECGDGGNSWHYAKYIFSLFRHYFTFGVHAYTYWNSVLPKGGMSTWGWKQNSMITVEDGHYKLNYEYFIMKHFSRYVRPGAVRLVLTGHWTSNSVAFKNVDGSVVLITQNPFKKSQALHFELEGNEYFFDLPADSINTFIF